MARTKLPNLTIQELADSYGLDARVARLLIHKHRIKSLAALEEFYNEKGRLGHVLALGDVLSVRACLEAVKAEPLFAARAEILVGRVSDELQWGPEDQP